MHRKVLIAALALGAGFCVERQSAAVRAAEPPTDIQWLTDYYQATEQAKAEKKSLLILFQNRSFNTVPDPYEVKYLPAHAALKNYVTAKLPVSTLIAINGKETRLLDHGAFREMKGGPGIAIIDFAHSDKPYFGYVVSQFPFARGRYYDFRPEHLPVALTLPEGTLTQRTMVYAVRVHPEHPASTQGLLHPVLADEATSHSGTQAKINVQGHHQWESRFHRIIGRLFNFGTRPQIYPTEVCAESWAHEDLLDSCVDCIASWRQSDGHWSAVKAYHASYGYDIRQGSNTIWYATGIFAN